MHLERVELQKTLHLLIKISKNLLDAILVSKSLVTVFSEKKYNKFKVPVY